MGPSRGFTPVAPKEAAPRVTEAERSQVTEQPTVRVAVATAEGTDKRNGTASRNETTTTSSKTNRFARLQLIALIALIVLQTALLFISVVPERFTVQLGWSSGNGPFPAATAPVVTLIFYLLPVAVGCLAQRWEVALFGATLPAWLALGLYTIAASSRNGIFAFIQGAQPTYLVGTMELFAVLGGFGWVTRRALLEPLFKKEQ
jgi:hypothetical protein